MKMNTKKLLNSVAMQVAGWFLIVAAAMKAHQLLTEPVISDGFWESWLFFVIQIPLEMGLGIWMVCGLFKKAAWLLGTIAYGGFIIVTLHKAIIGEASCGCFGTVTVNPWITLLSIDIPIFVMLAVFRPKGEKLLPPPWPSLKHFLAIAIPTFILLPALTYTVATNKQQKPAAKDWAANQRTDENLKWPLLDDIDIKEQLSSGLWVVLMYHNDCPDCTEAIPVYEQLSESLAGNEGAISFSFIEMPPYAEDISERLVSSDTKILCGRLSDRKKWFLQTPVVVIINDGAVIEAWEGYAPSLDEIFTAAFGQ